MIGVYFSLPFGMTRQYDKAHLASRGNLHYSINIINHDREDFTYPGCPKIL